MITKLQGREKVVWNKVADKVNEIIDYLNMLEEQAIKEENDNRSS